MIAESTTQVRYTPLRARSCSGLACVSWSTDRADTRKFPNKSVDAPDPERPEAATDS